MATSPILLCISIALSGWVGHVTGDYQVEITFHSYLNPSGKCDGCRQTASSAPGCCDNSSALLSEDECFDPNKDPRGIDTCDTLFDYCIRALGSTAHGCTEDQLIHSGYAFENINDYPFSPFFLGVENPLIVTNTSQWAGIQLFLQSRDANIVNHGFTSSILIDTFIIDIDLLVGVVTTPTTYTGNASIAQLNVSIAVNCSDNFYGPDCSTFCPDFVDCAGCGLAPYEGPCCETNSDDCVGANCSEMYYNTRCVDRDNGFDCVCNLGYTGEDCDVRIDYCVNVSCSSNGVCVNSIYGYDCSCNTGFAGVLCEHDIDDCVGVNCSGNGVCVDEVDGYKCQCNNSYEGRDCQHQQPQNAAAPTEGPVGVAYPVVVSAVSGTVFGVVLLICVCVLVVALVWLLHKRSWRTAHIHRTHNYTEDDDFKVKNVSNIATAPSNHMNGVSDHINGVSSHVNAVSDHMNGVSDHMNGVSYHMNSVSDHMNGHMNSVSDHMNGVLKSETI